MPRSARSTRITSYKLIVWSKRPPNKSCDISCCSHSNTKFGSGWNTRQQSLTCAHTYQHAMHLTGAKHSEEQAMVTCDVLKQVTAISAAQSRAAAECAHTPWDNHAQQLEFHKTCF
eukprot:6473191-Amphidinium_carterae.1